MTISIAAYNNLIQKMRHFFMELKYVEVPSQSTRSILAACEDPFTISKYEIAGEVWPLPQTGQMNLERALLENEHFEGVYCITTSYRNEPNPIRGRHDIVFPMFEFEGRGTKADLTHIEHELLKYLGFNVKELESITYKALAEEFGVDELVHQHETYLTTQKRNIVFIQDFPEYTSPFWNMKRIHDDLAAKVDVILYGMETIGSAERSCNPIEMKENFYAISDGEYAQKLFDDFEEKRVLKELDEYFKLKFTPRFGAGIGLTRLIRAYVEMKNNTHAY